MASAPDIAKLYNRANFATANHPRVIAQLHRRCVQLIQRSLQSASPKRNYLNSAQNILAEFERSLDTKNSLAENLFHLYDYCHCRLETNDPDDHRVALAILIKIRDAFDVLLSRDGRSSTEK
jgi:flagellin-specific chaperone FliS